ncbi:hypothetical protein SEA_HORUS_45 [Gordonia phage Horus]|uniref:Uncharacterized protein n=2 Tax=Caudoviricetes TaxID=2731619 RepID=A0A345L152_9CAUD|nr:hypothetical protein HOT72_gp044 [Gordonia phage Apricot]YP_009808283.1 hypothetical protein HOT93_gp045 [Gordonia phage Horus]QSL99793.1 hypothetical protein SEA_ODAY_49 [Gordonia phage ODay]QYC53712.1 hypothetical protein SEA_LEROY_45 [Gordonia phage Leroy]WNM69755.1 hypothetical protein SEA_CRATER_47 [Gordonia phage Crater]AXH49004.1 hypothetical protein SEA_APRICOT_44 [Gordonia phage Apricot]AXQ63898.1 hypothetical protein SEA_HORUS_45 [Gordonia phage Horus]
MTISHRLWDDSVFLPPGEAMPPPAFVGQLLARLHLEDSPRADQVAGIREWLTTNTPSLSLRMSLTRRGFGGILESLGEPVA